MGIVSEGRVQALKIVTSRRNLPLGKPQFLELELPVLPRERSGAFRLPTNRVWCKNLAAIHDGILESQHIPVLKAAVSCGNIPLDWLLLLELE